MAAVAALGCCCILGGLLQLWVKELSPSSNLLVGLGISCTLVWARLYIVNGIGLDLAAMVVGFTTDVCVEVTVVATTSGSVLTGKYFSTIHTLNCLFMGVLVLIFLSAALLGTGVFQGKVVLPS